MPYDSLHYETLFVHDDNLEVHDLYIFGLFYNFSIAVNLTQLVNYLTRKGEHDVFINI